MTPSVRSTVSFSVGAKRRGRNPLTRFPSPEGRAGGNNGERRAGPEHCLARLPHLICERAPKGRKERRPWRAVTRDTVVVQAAQRRLEPEAFAVDAWLCHRIAMAFTLFGPIRKGSHSANSKGICR